MENTFTSIPDVGAHHFPWLPTHWVMGHRLDSLTKIRSYQGPLLQSHGDADRVIPYEQGQKLFEAAPGPKQFITNHDRGHNDPSSEEFHRALDQFIAGLPRSNQGQR